MESGFGWREWVMLAAVVAGVYLLVALVALARLRRRKSVAAAIEPTDFGAAGFRSHEAPPGQAWEHPFRTPAPLPPKEPEAIPVEIDLVIDDVSRPPAIPDPGHESRPFAATLALTGLEAEVRQLRSELGSLREEVNELKAARRISPLYADAAALAHRGFDARGVAEECGISVAEAELVLAMSRDEKDFDSEVRNGTDGNR